MSRPFPPPLVAVAYVDAVCVSEVEGCRKPDPRILRIAAEKCTMTLHDAWLVRDDGPADIGAAKALPNTYHTHR